MAYECRYCSRPLDAGNPDHAKFWPFCSERCKTAELGLWLQDRYVISRPFDQVSDDAAPPPETTDASAPTPTPTKPRTTRRPPANNS